jgi:tetratricopeptide (TPR) repeat protein
MEIEIIKGNENVNALAAPAVSSVLAQVAPKAPALLARMFADPYLLAKEDRTDLVQGLRACVAAHPHVSELRVLFGMALCVDYKVQEAIEELQEGVRLAPDSFIAQLKMGELWMRLRVVERAEEHTRQAALLAQNMAQSELARRQAATIRGYVHNGIRRGAYAYKGPIYLLTLVRRLWTRNRSDADALVATAEIQ